MTLTKKVLIITYYFPPSGGAGVQRWLKFTKYLPENGWQPVIYTAKNPHYPSIDNSLLTDVPANVTVLKGTIWEPYEWYKKWVGMKKEAKFQAGFLTEDKHKPTIMQNIAIWVRGNFFIPDARIGWLHNSVKILSKYLSQNPVDAIISTGPPHTAHLIAQKLSKQFNLPWIADFRDPWTEISYYKKFKLTPLAHAIHKQMEKKVLKNANCVVTVSPTWKNDFLRLGASNCECITNGYDTDDFLAIQQNTNTQQKFTICHIGTFIAEQNPFNLWIALAQLCNENKRFNELFELKFVGKVDLSILENIEKCGLTNKLQKIDYVPHKQVVNYTSQSTLLLLLVNDIPNSEGIIPGKLFEYMAVNRPILCFGSKNADAVKIIEQNNCGITFSYQDFDPIKKTLLNYFNAFLNNTIQTPTLNIEQFSRRSLTKKLAHILNNL